MRTAPHLRSLPGGRRPDALVPGRGHVYLHTSMQPAAPKPELFDREDHSERPTLPTLVDLSLSVLASYFLAPTANPHDTTDPTRWASAQDAARIVAMWRAGGVPADECDPHGIPRPGAS